MSITHRKQILIEQERHEALTSIARRKKRRLSDIIREMLWKQLEKRKKQDLATAARELRDDYQIDPNLITFTSIDGAVFIMC